VLTEKFPSRWIVRSATAAGNSTLKSEPLEEAAAATIFLDQPATSPFAASPRPDR
jgi:hypothetical protein